MSNNNEFLFRARRLKEQNKTLLEAYGERDIVTFFRYNMPKMQDNNSSLVEANYDFGPVIEHAALLNEKIDMFDENEGLLDQVIFGIQFPKLCHPGVADIVGDRRLVALLLVRHFKKFGGLVLPPLDGTQELAQTHAKVLEKDMEAGRPYTAMHYPNWRDTKMMPAPPGPDEGGGGSSAPPGQGSSGAIGDSRYRGGN